MANNVVHFAIEADDVERAKAFYQAVFGWRFEAWGPPDFYVVHTGVEGDPGIGGALQKRRVPLENDGTTGFECTISVEDVDVIAEAITANGGRVVMEKTEIPTVGWLIQFKDTEGNIVSAMKYGEMAG